LSLDQTVLETAGQHSVFNSLRLYKFLHRNEGGKKRKKQSDSEIYKYWNTTLWTATKYQFPNHDHLHLLH